MNRITLSADDLARFREDGVVCLRGVIDMPMVEALRQVLPEHLAGPTSLELELDGKSGKRYAEELRERRNPATGLRRVRSRAAKAWQRVTNKVATVAHPPKRATHAFNGWQRYDIYRDLIFKTDVARAAAEFMGSSIAQLVYDESFNKEPGAVIPVNWHQDIVYWPMTGDQTCSVWIALDEVTQDSGAVSYLAGSHRWPDRYKIEIPLTPETAHIANINLPEPPNYFEIPDAKLTSWDLSPGDALFFSANILHGSRGNSTTDRSRRSVTSRFLGDDIRFVEGEHLSNGLWGDLSYMKAGDAITGPQFPIAWRRP